MANEKRLIDANALEEHFRKTKVIEVFPNWKDLPPNVTSAVIRFAKKWREIVLNAPTVEAVEVVHGRWVHTDKAAHWYGKDECNICTYHSWDRLDLTHFKYCPNCGAKMDGDGNGQ